MDHVLKALVLAGGSGSRLWPLSRQQLPKQFLNLNGEHSMLSATIARLQPMIRADDVWVVTGESHATGEAFSELEGLNQILEPCGRNTAPAIALAAALLQDICGDDPVMVVLPADHLVTKKEAFQGCLQDAVAAAEDGRMVTMDVSIQSGGLSRNLILNMHKKCWMTVTITGIRACLCGSAR